MEREETGNKHEPGVPGFVDVSQAVPPEEEISAAEAAPPLSTR